MKNAGTAMKQIHSGLTIEKVDETMYVLAYILNYFGSLANMSYFL